MATDFLKYLARPCIPQLLFFVIIFCLFTTPVLDGDFFWHLQSGSWIWEHGHLPGSDPFSYTVADSNPLRPASKRVPFILHQYWLGQLTLFGIWEAFGSAGIVTLRACSFTGILLFLHNWMIRRQSGIWPLLLVFLAGSILREFPSERPQIFSFIFMPVLLYLLERTRSERFLDLHWRVTLLPALMVVWANMHGGYILGVVLIGVYLLFELRRWWVDRNSDSRNRVLLLIAAAVISGVNPSGFRAFPEAMATHSVYASAILENLSPVTAALKLHELYPAFWGFLLLVCGVAAARFRCMVPEHLAVLAVLALLALSGLRYMPFFLMAAPLLIPYLPARDWSAALVAAASLLLLLWGATTPWSGSFNFGVNRLFPAQAARFITAARPAPQLFNYYDWGGFAMRYIPGYKVFIDGRGLVEELFDLYSQALWTDRWHEIFEHNQVNTVMIPGVSKTSGATYPLALHLAEHPAWHLVYGDDVSLVFVRDVPGNSEVIRQYARDRHEVHRHLLMLLDLLPAGTSARPDYWISKGNALYQLGRYREASDAYRRVLEIEPGNMWAGRMLVQLGRLLPQGAAR